MGKRVRTMLLFAQKVHTCSFSAATAGPGDAPADTMPLPDQEEEAAEAVLEAGEDKERCNHYTKDSAHLNRVLQKICSKKKCGNCRKQPARMRGGMKGKQQKKKHGVSEKAELNAIWVCLDCGQHFCGGLRSKSVPYGHARWHAKQERHWWAVQSNDLTATWCFSCGMKVQMEMPETKPAIAVDDKAVTAEVLDEMLKVALVATTDDKAPAVEVPDEMPKAQAASAAADNKAVVAGCIGLVLDNMHGHVIRGMENVGNTCFFNSVLQNLLAINMLRKKMAWPDISTGPLTMALKKVFMETSSTIVTRNVLNPKNLFDCICSQAQRFKGGKPHDSLELLHCLLSGLQREDARTRTSDPAANVINSIFGGKLLRAVSCAECGHTVTRHKLFVVLSLPVPLQDPSARRSVLLLSPKKSKPSISDENKSWRFHTASNSQNPEDLAPPPPVCSVTESSRQGTFGGATEQEDSVGEPEVTSHAKRETGTGEDINLMSWNGSSTDDEVGDSGAPVSLEACLSLYTKLKLLTGEQAWYCEHCSVFSPNLYAEQRKDCQQMMMSSGCSDNLSPHIDDNEDTSGAPSLVDAENSSDGSVLGDGKMTMTNTNATLDGQTEQSERKGYQNKSIRDFNNSSIECSVGNNRDAECGEFCREGATSSLPIEKKTILLSDSDNENVNACNQDRWKQMKLGDKAREVQEDKSKHKENELNKVMRGSAERLLISKEPNVLIIRLMRLCRDADGQFYKLESHVSFQEILDIRPYMDPRRKGKENCCYRLSGVIEHTGHVEHGHYVAYVRGDRIGDQVQRSSGRQSWFFTSDELVKEVSLSYILTRQAYILFYEKVEG